MPLTAGNAKPSQVIKMSSQPQPKIIDVGQPTAMQNSRPVIVGHRPVMPDPVLRRPMPPVAPAAVKPVALQTKPAPAAPAPAAGTAIPVTVHAPAPAPAPTKPAEPAPKIVAEAPKPQAEDLSPKANIAMNHNAKTIAVSEEIQAELLKVKKPLDSIKLTTEASLASAPAAAGTGQMVNPMPAGEGAAIAEINNSFNVKDVVTPADMPHLQPLPVSHHSASGAGRMRLMLLWMIILVGAFLFIAYAAIDAGVVNTSIKLPFHIFSPQG
jgi:hypothetical protein